VLIKLSKGTGYKLFFIKLVTTISIFLRDIYICVRFVQMHTLNLTMNQTHILYKRYNSAIINAETVF